MPKKPRYKFCWWCSRKLHNDVHAILEVDGREVILHKCCVAHVKAQNVTAKHRTADEEERRW